MPLWFLPPHGGSYVDKRTASTPSCKWPHASLDSTLRWIPRFAWFQIWDLRLKI